MLAKMWSPKGNMPDGATHIGLTSGHTFVIPHDKDGIEVPHRFRKKAIAHGCIPVCSEPEKTQPDTFDRAAAMRGSAKRRVAHAQARDDSAHQAVARGAAAVDPMASARPETPDGRALLEARDKVTVADHQTVGATLRDRTANATRLHAWLIDRCRIEEKGEIERRTVQNSGPNPLRNKRALDAALAELAETDRVRLFKSGRQKLIEVHADRLHVATAATVDSLAEDV